MNSIDKRLEKLQARRAREIAAQAETREQRLIREEIDWQFAAAVKLQRRRNAWDRRKRFRIRRGLSVDPAVFGERP